MGKDNHAAVSHKLCGFQGRVRRRMFTFSVKMSWQTP
jgi:hypothetical protein